METFLSAVEDVDRLHRATPEGSGEPARDEDQMHVELEEGRDRQEPAEDTFQQHGEEARSEESSAAAGKSAPEMEEDRDTEEPAEDTREEKVMSLSDLKEERQRERLAEMALTSFKLGKLEESE